MGIRFCSLGLRLLLALALLMGARMAWSDEPKLDALPVGYHSLEREMLLNKIWPGQSYEVLLDVFGAPKLTLRIPGHSNTSEFVAIFGIIDAASQCLDSFAVYRDDVQEYRVKEYFCR